MGGSGRAVWTALGVWYWSIRWRFYWHLTAEALLNPGDEATRDDGGGCGNWGREGCCMICISVVPQERCKHQLVAR